MVSKPHTCAVCTFMVPGYKVTCDLHWEETPVELRPVRPVHKQTWAKFYDYWRVRIEAGYKCPPDREMKAPRQKTAADFADKGESTHVCFINQCAYIISTKYMMCYECMTWTKANCPHLVPHKGMTREEFAELQLLHATLRKW